MSHNKVWVTWEDPYNGKPLATQVKKLDDDSNVDDLKQAFVKQQEPDIKRPAAIEVREPGKSEILDEEDELKKYFVGTKRETAGPGQSKTTALILTLPEASLPANLKLERVEKTERGDSGLYYIRDNHAILTNPRDKDSNISPIRRIGPAISFDVDCSDYSNDKITSALQQVKKKGVIDTHNLIPMLSRLDTAILKSAISLVNHCGIDMGEATMTEMPLQQFIYSPLSALFLAAAGGFRGSTNKKYRADSNVNSYVWVHMKEHVDDPDDQYKAASLTMQPDAAVTLMDTYNSIGMMEIKPNAINMMSEDFLIHYDKCTLATACTAIILSKCLDSAKVNLEDLALPFVIATGKYCSLFVTRLDRNGVPYVSCVVEEGNEVSHPLSRGVDFTSAIDKPKSKLFVALAVVLNNVLELLGKDESWEARLRKKLSPIVSNGLPRAIPSRSTKRKSKSDANGSESNSKKGKKANTASSEHMEPMAMDAAACDGRFLQVKYPFLRNLVFTSSDCHIDSQTESPFYFRGLDRDNDRQVFIKVWSATDTQENRVAREFRHLWTAYTAGVPVAKPIFETIVKSRSKRDDDIEFFIIATELINEQPLTSPAEMLSFSIALIAAVKMLHDKTGILHCDLKPDNVCWNGHDALLIDFGHGQLIADATWSPGTEGFEAPEILREECASVKTDAFAVGRIVQCVLERDILVAYKSDSSTSPLTDIKAVAEHLCEEDPALRWTLDQALDALSGRSIAKRKERSARPAKGVRLPSEKLPRKCVSSF